MDGLDLQIEKLKQKLRTDSYIETVLDFAKTHVLDVEDIVKELSAPIVDQIKYEFIKQKVVKEERAETSMESFFED